MKNIFNYQDVNVSVEADAQPVVGKSMNCRAIFSPDRQTLSLIERVESSWRNPEVFRGDHILVTQKRDGSFRTTILYSTSEPNINSVLMHEMEEALAAVEQYEQKRREEQERSKAGVKKLVKKGGKK